MEEYTTRELGLLLTGLHTKVDEVFEQTKSTNGRVRKLEVWKARIGGALLIISVIITGLVIPLTLDHFKKDDVSKQVNAAVSDSLSQYFTKE